MTIIEEIKPVTYFKSHAAEMLAQINETRRPVVVTQNGEARAVLQDPESYQNMRNALGLLKLLAQGEDDVKKDKLSNQDEVFSRLTRTLEK